MNEHSISFWSPHYSAHMNMDTTLPGIFGYITAMLFNPNNVALEGGPITTYLEILVGQQLCEMLGFNNKATDKDLPLDAIASRSMQYDLNKKKGLPLA